MLHRLNQLHKKGITTALFTWIFVSIAGVLILIFFINFALNNAGISSEISNIRYLEDINNIITAFATSSEANKAISLPRETEVYFDCSNILLTQGSKDYTKKTPGNIIFGTERFSGNKLLLWTQEWKLPFKITNFVYLSSPDIKYNLIYDFNSQEEVSEIESAIPDIFNVESINLNQLNLRTLDRENNVKNKFVFFTTPAKLNDIFKMDTPASVVQIDAGDFGEVTYYKEGSQKSSSYITKQLIYGAIFTDDYDTYSCLITRSMDHLSLVSSLYAEKARLLQIKTIRQCSYSQIKVTLDNYGSIAKTLNMQEVFSRSEALINQNRQIDNQDCSTIF